MWMKCRNGFLIKTLIIHCNLTWFPKAKENLFFVNKFSKYATKCNARCFVLLFFVLVTVLWNIRRIYIQFNLIIKFLNNILFELRVSMQTYNQ